MDEPFRRSWHQIWEVILALWLLFVTFLCWVSFFIFGTAFLWRCVSSYLTLHSYLTMKWDSAVSTEVSESLSYSKCDWRHLILDALLTTNFYAVVLFHGHCRITSLSASDRVYPLQMSGLWTLFHFFGSASSVRPFCVAFSLCFKLLLITITVMVSFNTDSVLCTVCGFRYWNQKYLESIRSKIWAFTQKFVPLSV